MYKCSSHEGEQSKYRRDSDFSTSCALSGLPHSIPVRRTGHLISNSPLSDELAVEVAWLWGKAAKFPYGIPAMDNDFVYF